MKSPFSGLPPVKAGRQYKDSMYNILEVVGRVTDGEAGFSAVWPIEKPRQKKYLHSIPEGTEMRRVGKEKRALTIALLLLSSLWFSAGPAWAQEPADFRIRLGAAVGPGPKAGVLDFLIGAGGTKSRSTVIAARDETGRINQMFATGVERELLTRGWLTLAVAGAAGVAYNEAAVSGLTQGASTVVVKVWRDLSVVIDGVGTNAPAQGGEWEAKAQLSLQWEFR